MNPAQNELRRQPAAVKFLFDSVARAAAECAVDKSGTNCLTADAARAVLRDTEVPIVVGHLLAKYPEDKHGAILDSVLRGAAEYKRMHGIAPDETTIEFALWRGLRAATPLKELGLDGARLDSASNSHHDQLSLNPAAPIVAIMAMLSEAMPFAAYLPADVKSNEARLAIFDTKANSDFGNYLVGDTLSGIAGGGTYLSSERYCLLSANGGGNTAPLTYTVTQKADVAAGAGNVAMPLLRGRTVIFVNGLPVARESDVNYSAGTGNNSLSGQVTIAATTYTITGTVNSDTGAISVSTSANLPAGTKVVALAYIDYERAPDYAPKVGTEVNVYKLFAKASRGIAKVSIDAMTQMQQELSLDPRGQALMALRSQYASELHYQGLQKMFDIGLGFAEAWAYGYSTQVAEKARAEMWLELAPILTKASQKMAERTVDYGIGVLYFTGELAAQLDGLPSTIFESSGLRDRPGIYRKGRLFGKYECYYTPKKLTETGNGDTSQILAIGRGSQVARNPLVRGEAVPPVLLPLATNTDMVTQDGFYARDFSEVNPHSLSAQGATVINVTGIKS